MYRAIKVRIYPTDEQESYLAQCFGNTRWLWNYMLNATTVAYKEISIGLSKAAMDKLLPGLKKEYEWLGLAYSQVLQRVTLVESRAGIIPRPSLLNLGVRLSSHPASDVLSFRFCSCEYNRGSFRVWLEGF